jgi:hypothetical protein
MVEHGQRFSCVMLLRPENMTGVRRPIRLYAKIGTFCLASLASAFLCCVGCSIHETNRWGQSQDFVTFMLAGGTYISLAVFVGSLVLFVITLMRDPSAGEVDK